MQYNKVYQKDKHDCLQAAYATLLGINYDDIPQFYVYESDVVRYESEVDKFLWSLNKFRIVFDCKNNGKDFPYFGIDKIPAIGILKKEDRKYSHAIVIEVIHVEQGSLEYRIELVHDPKKNSDYTFEDMTGIEMISDLPVTNHKKGDAE